MSDRLIRAKLTVGVRAEVFRPTSRVDGCDEERIPVAIDSDTIVWGQVVTSPHILSLAGDPRRPLTFEMRGLVRDMSRPITVMIDRAAEVLVEAAAQQASR